ncbi:XRE family transcriptional regulator [Uliginosibacterium flavum]|uniref:XRE family transcriptional regulator n=1 Tax=Uliginosibacterium flavum TaxID=1396831 RepID=A0ABV2TLI0_9RHOO
MILLQLNYFRRRKYFNEKSACIEIPAAPKERVIYEKYFYFFRSAKLFGVTQPRISDLLHSKINLFGLDSLVNMATAAGIRIEMRINGTLA